MNATIEKLRVRQILDLLPSLMSDSLDRIIAAAQVELRDRDSAELFKEAFDDMLARQYARDDMLFGKTNALEGIE